MRERHELSTKSFSFNFSSLERNIALLDIGITCPATASHVSRKSHLIPGVAASYYYATKRKKYRDVRHFIPFIIETGGRLHDRARDFIDDIVDEEGDEEGEAEASTQTLPSSISLVATGDPFTAPLSHCHPSLHYPFIIP